MGADHHVDQLLWQSKSMWWQQHCSISTQERTNVCAAHDLHIRITGPTHVYTANALLCHDTCWCHCCSWCPLTCPGRPNSRLCALCVVFVLLYCMHAGHQNYSCSNAVYMRPGSSPFCRCSGPVLPALPECAVSCPASTMDHSFGNTPHSSIPTCVL